MKQNRFEEQLTYNNGRKCQFPQCGKPIADHVHALRKFCPRDVLPDGSIKCCKDDFHSEIKKKENEPYKGIVNHHMSMDNRIGFLLKRKGEFVDIEDLNKYGIKLNRPAEILRYPDKNEVHYYFVKFLIINENNNFKIIKHDTLF